MCDLETSWMRRSWPTGGVGLSHQKQTKNCIIIIIIIIIIITNAYYNYTINTSIIITILAKTSSRNAIRKKFWQEMGAASTSSLKRRL